MRLSPRAFCPFLQLVKHFVNIRLLNLLKFNKLQRVSVTYTVTDLFVKNWLSYIIVIETINCFD